MLALIPLATEAADPSKTPFYIAGGLFALYAVIVGVVGIRSETFPPSEGAGRVMMVISVVLAAAAMATAVATA